MNGRTDRRSRVSGETAQGFPAFREQARRPRVSGEAARGFPAFRGRRGGLR
jgi:hypothetical protein